MRDLQTSFEGDMPCSDLFDFIPNPMIILSLDGRPIYLNAAYTGVFGWTRDDLKSHYVPPVPVDLQKKIKRSFKKYPRINLFQIETKWPTKKGEILDVDVTGKFVEYGHGSMGVAISIKDITKQAKIYLTNNTLLRISTALPCYPALEDLMDYISNEVSCLLNTEGAVVMLLDEESNEIFFQGVGMDDSNRQKLIKKIRIPADKSITGRVIRTGEPLIVHNTAKVSDYYTGVDEQLNISIKNMLFVPLINSNRVIGVLSALNKKEGRFDDTDLELLKMIAGTVALSIENARVSDQLKNTCNEVLSVNRAKDRLINHLSHELKTPVSVLLASMNIIEKRLISLPEEEWAPTLERARRNLDRILGLQYELEDIMYDNEYKVYGLLSFLLDECSDALESLVAEEVGEGAVVQHIRNRIKEIFKPDRSETNASSISRLLNQTLDALRPSFSHRNVEISQHIEETHSVNISEDALRKILEGLTRNAIENTPDEGKIKISLVNHNDCVEFSLQDYGTGITEENQKLIFEGFYPTQETMQYSSKRPFDFNAGGKGADLLRIRIFSERYGFKIYMESSRCAFIPRNNDICPGMISRCVFCRTKEDCHNSGGTTFRLLFPVGTDTPCT